MEFPKSKNLSELKRLIYQERYEIYNTQIRGDSNGFCAKVELRKGEDVQVIDAIEDPPFFHFVATIKDIPIDGEIGLGPVKDIESYYANAFHSGHEEERRKAVLEVLAAGEGFSVKDLPYRNVIDKVLSGTVDSDVVTLKNNYIEFLIGLELMAIDFSTFFSQYMGNNVFDAAVCEYFFEEVFNIYNTAYWRHGPVNSYTEYKRVPKLDLDKFSSKFMTQWNFKNDLFKRLEAIEGIPGEEESLYLADIYRRFLELSRPLVIDLASAILHKNGEKNIQPSMSVEEATAIIANDDRLGMLENYFPFIGHSESHADTVWDSVSEEVIFQDSRSGEIIEVGRMNLEDLLKATLEIQDLLVAKFAGAVFFDSANIVRMVSSPDFKYLLFDIEES